MKASAYCTPVADHYKTVIPSEASRRFFFRVRSCERVGLRSEESLFDSSSSSRLSSSALPLRPLRLCVIFFFSLLLTTHYSLPTTHSAFLLP